MSRAFDGTFQHLDSAPQAISSQLADITVCAWVKPIIRADVVSYFLVKDPDNLATNSLYVDGDSGFNNGFGGFSSSATPTPTAGESDTLEDVLTPDAWAHLAYSISFVAGGEPKLYLNGVLITEYNTAQSALPPNAAVSDDSGTPWRLGGFTSNFPELSFQGELADVRIYNAILTDGQVASVAAGGSPVPSNLVAWWKLCAADPFADSSGNGNVLTNFGTTLGLSEPPVSVCGSTAFSYTDSRNYGTFPNDSRDVQGTLTYDVPSEYSLKHWFDTSFNPTEPLPLDSRAAGAPEDSRVAAIIPENSRADF